MLDDSFPKTFYISHKKFIFTKLHQSVNKKQRFGKVLSAFFLRSWKDHAALNPSKRTLNILSSHNSPVLGHLLLETFVLDNSVVNCDTLRPDHSDPRQGLD